MTKLKCWKKLPKDNEWYRTDIKYSYARVWRTGLPSSEIKRRGIKPHIFSARIGRDGTTTKEYFKKEKEALKFADKYMKKHDRC